MSIGSIVKFELDMTRFGVQVATLREAMREEPANALYGFVQETMELAKSTMGALYTSGRWVTGALRDSGYVERPVVDKRGSIMVEAGFGKAEGWQRAYNKKTNRTYVHPDDPSAYALHVHEGHELVAWGVATDEYIPPTKFWELPLYERLGSFEREVGQPIGVIINRSWQGY